MQQARKKKGEKKKKTFGWGIIRREGYEKKRKEERERIERKIKVEGEFEEGRKKRWLKRRRRKSEEERGKRETELSAPASQ